MNVSAARTAGNIVIVGAILYAAWLMLWLTLPYTALRPGVDFLRTKVNVYHIDGWRLAFYVHVFTGLMALLSGLTQFSAFVLRRYSRTHRVMGYIYVVNVLLITGPAALLLSVYANGGMAAQLSFILQSVCWLVFTAIALQKARTRQFLSHGEWMLRSYALTLAAITLRAYAALIALARLDIRPVPRYILIAWASWTINLLIAELLIRKGFVKKIFAVRSKEVERRF